MDIFSFTQCVGVAQVVWCFFSEEIVSYFLAEDLVCLWEEISSQSSYIAILNLPLDIFFKISTMSHYPN